MKSVRNLTYAPYRQRMRDGVVYELDVFEWTQLEFASGNYTEPDTVALIKNLLGEGDVFIDVGAHVGTLGLIARKHIGASGKVISIEPQPYNCERLLKNWELNSFSNLSLYVAAAGPEPGSIALPQQSSTDKARLSLRLDMPDATSLSFNVPMVTVDSVIEKERAKRIKLLKIDVEGFEFEVLKGTSSHVELIDNIILEVLDREDAGNSETSGIGVISQWLLERGFELFTVTGVRWTKELSLPESNLWAARPKA